MATPALTYPLSYICDVSVTEAAVAVSGPTFNQALVLGSSSVIPSYGTNPRVRQYTSTAAMLNDGFATNDPEYVAAQIYFSQSPAPTYFWAGRLDLTALQTVIPHSGAAGTGYVVGDIINVVQGGASNGQVRVSTIGSGGSVTGLTLVSGSQGTGYSTATDLSTTGGTGTGLAVDITAIGETPVQAIEQCRLYSGTWYTFFYPQGQDADHVNLAQWAAQTDQQSYYLYSTQSASAITGASGNVFSTISGESLGRNFGVYASTQSGLFPNNPYEPAAIGGRMMGLNTGLEGSAFSLLYKSLTGIAPENPGTLGSQGLQTLTTNKGNAYVTFANAFPSVWPGVGGDGIPPDQQLFTDMLVSQIQYGVANQLTAYNKIPQTNAGQKILLAAANQACATLAGIGFIAAGVWNGQPINQQDGLNLNTGDSLPLGYRCMSPLFKYQSQADRDALKMMPIYIAIILAGSGRSVAVSLTVQR